MQIFTRTLTNGPFEILWIDSDGVIKQHYFSLTKVTQFLNQYDQVTLDLIYAGKFNEISEEEASKLMNL